MHVNRNLLTVINDGDTVYINLDNIEFCVVGPAPNKICLTFHSGRVLTLSDAAKTKFEMFWNNQEFGYSDGD